MRKFVVCIGIAVLFCAVLSSQLFAQAAAPAGPKYIGAAGCKPCHLPAYKTWVASAHAHADSVLMTPQAKKIAADKGIADPLKSEKCTKCHVTGFDAKPELKDVKYQAADGVGCESCHGPGSNYKLVMRDAVKAKEKGLILRTTVEEQTALCTKCHNAESPTGGKFDMKTFWPKVAHMLPKKAAG